MYLKNLLKKSLLMGVALLAGASGAWADDWTTVWTTDFSSAPSGMTYSVTNGSVSIANGYLSYSNVNAGNNRAINTAFTDAAFAVSTNWKMEFDWNCHQSNQNPSNAVFATNNGTAFTIEWPANGSNPATITSSTSTTLTSTLPNLGNSSRGTMSSSSHFVITGIVGEGVYLTVTNGATTYVDNQLVTSTFGYPATFNGSLGRASAYMYLDNINFATPKVAGFVNTPTYTITGPDGTSRKFTLDCLTDGVTIYWASSDLEKGAAGWNTYSSEVTTSDATIYIYAEDGEGNTSEKTSFSTGAGTEISLNDPTITINNLIANGAYYNARFDAWYNTAGVEFTPAASLSATFTPEGGAASVVSLPYTVTQKGTLTITSTAGGFKSGQTEIEVPALYEQSWQSLDFSSLVGTEAVQAALDEYWTQQDGHDRWASWADKSYNFYQHGSAGSGNITINDKIKMREVVILAEGMGLGRNISGGEAVSVATSAGEIVGFEVYNGYGAVINKGVNTYKTYGINLGGNPSVSTNNGALLVQATIYSPATFTLSDGEAIRLTFDNAGVSGDNNNNWNLDIYNANEKISNVRADWWDGPNAGGNNTGFTYPYTFSSDNGATAATTNVWSTFQTDMADAAVDLTLSYSGGTVYVIGTMTKGSNVYYVNYRKEGQSGDLTYNLYGNGGATLSNINTVSASVLTTPAHPTNVAVTIGTNGYATYANNVYPLDLTSAPAYKAAIADDKVNFTLFEQAVPAGTGMLVEGSGTVNLPIADASTSVDGNAFKVNTSDAVFTAEANTTYYGMMKDMSPLTFGTFDPSAVAIPANKAYLAVSGASASRLTAVFGKATGINAIDSAKVANCYYNLNGQRVSKPANGLYVVNGKKVIIK